MARSKGGLQKNVRSIFQDAAMPDEVIASEPEVPSEPVSTPEADTVATPEKSPVQSPCESAPDVPVAESKPELSQPAEESSFSDPMIDGQMKKQKCEKDFSCYKSGLEDLCQARLIRRGKVVQCMEPKKSPCAYRITTFFKRICQCPIRIHIAKKHGK